MPRIDRARLATVFATCVLTLTSFSRAQTQPQWDFVFVLDNSISMNLSACGGLRSGGNLDKVRTGLIQFMSDLATKTNVDARFAVVTLASGSICNGGPPTLAVVQPFTVSQAAIQNAFSQITMSGPRESSLEGIRMALGTANFGFTPPLAFRPGALVNIIMATDEDSDSPLNAANRANPLQTKREPPSFSTNPTSAWVMDGWQTEIDLTAQQLVARGAFLNVVFDPTNNANATVRHQLGDPTLTVFTNNRLDRVATLTNLMNAGLGGSLQAQVLAGSATNLVAAAFDIRDPAFATKLFAAKFEETLCPCVQTATVSVAAPGWRASGGPVPTLGLAAGQTPVLCAGIDLQIGRTSPAMTYACILFGDALSPRQPLGPSSGTLYPGGPMMQEVGLVFSGLTPTYRVTVPCNDLSLCGTSVYVQAVYNDTVYPGQAAFSSTLQLVLGS